ncbi:MAG: molybdopterin-guanine dinucleotide biosynthesis protein B [Chloroflexi bacterium]|nr:molybdopterin-guanine dinucleotide biosynthesis protein B [Chloroflexota bacterium]
MAPIVSFVGHSGSGKTTFIERLIPELRSRGYHVATVKHTHHAITPDHPEKDSWRHLQAGSEAAVFCSPDTLTLTKLAAEAGLTDIARLLGEDYDIILVEGFKQDDVPKIEVHRRETGPLLTGLTRLFAIVSDEPLDTKIRQFTFEDVSLLADLLEEGFIKPQAERVSLYINGSPVILKRFIQDLIANVLTGIAVSLKGVGWVKSLEVFLHKKV